MKRHKSHRQPFIPKNIRSHIAHYTMTAPKSTIVLVTGANQGIGYEIAKKLGKDHEGYHVLVAGRRKEAVEEAAKKLQAEGCSVEPLVLDVTSDESIAEAAKTVDAKYGRLDVLINNAAISGGAEPLSRKLFLDILNTVRTCSNAFITPAPENCD